MRVYLVEWCIEGQHTTGGLSVLRRERSNIPSQAEEKMKERYGIRKTIFNDLLFLD